MKLTKKQIEKLRGSWWGERHEGPVLPKRNANSLRSVMSYAAAKKAAAVPQPLPTTELSQEILRGVTHDVAIPA